MRAGRSTGAPTRAWARIAACAAGAGAAAALACSIAVKRDLSAVPPKDVVFDDLCDLQTHFDYIAAKRATAPRMVSSVELTKASADRPSGGKSRFAFETDFQLAGLRRVLDRNWKRLPEPLAAARKVDLEVYWAEKAGIQRVATDRDAEIIIDREAFELPYHVCLSELLFGEPLYRQRRELLGLPALPPVDGGTDAPEAAAPPSPFAADAGDGER